MAIKLTHSFHGITVTDAYHRIDRMIGEHKRSLVVQVVTYVDAAHALARDPLPVTRSYTLEWPTAANAPTPSCDYTAYAYAQLMLLPEFAGGVAV